MHTIRIGTVGLTCLVALLAGPAAFAGDQPLTIYDIQFNTLDGDQSIYNGQIHSVTGGIVTYIWAGSRSRVYLQDPAHPSWGGIVVKDWQGGEMADNVQLGDWVSLENILIEEYRGTTYLQYNRSWAPNVSFNVVSQGNPLPDAVLLTAADLPVPVNHAASEPYESMVAMLESVVVGQMDLGKNADNYELLQGADVAWGTDYMNVDAGGPYHPLIHTGAVLERIRGIVDQYTRPEEGWDYYQLCTRSSADIVPEPGALVLLLAAGILVGRRR